MARNYAVCLGAIALLIGSLRGAALAHSPAEVLPTALAMCIAFTCLGWVIGATADYLIRQSLEAKFRQTVQQYQERQRQPAKESVKAKAT